MKIFKKNMTTNVNIILNHVKLVNDSIHLSGENTQTDVSSAWFWSKKENLIKPKLQLVLFSAQYRNCTVHKPVNVYTEDTIGRFTFSIAGCHMIVLFPIKAWAARFYLVLTHHRHSVFHPCGPAALGSSCIIEILVAALIVFHANLVCAQHLCGV